MGELVGSGIELFIGEGLVFKDYGCVFGGSFGLFFKKSVDGLIFGVVFVSFIKVQEDMSFFFWG